uniref:Putative secreted peptide n=1 Tax=Anopheles braziliensis TaxID=58242 RepID=A0A2M3ZND5_9DIPT
MLFLVLLVMLFAGDTRLLLLLLLLFVALPHHTADDDKCNADFSQQNQPLHQYAQTRFCAHTTALDCCCCCWRCSCSVCFCCCCLSSMLLLRLQWCETRSDSEAAREYVEWRRTRSMNSFPLSSLSPRVWMCFWVEWGLFYAIDKERRRFDAVRDDAPIAKALSSDARDQKSNSIFK